MIVFLPTFKRTKIIKHVILTIIKANYNSIDERILLLIHNNNINSKNKLIKIISKIEIPKKIDIHLFNREDSAMTPFEKWFDCIFKFAKNNETIIMMGDDDLMLPFGIENRFKYINQHSADFLLCPFYERVYFVSDGSKLIKTNELSKNINISKPKLKKWDPNILEHNNTTFISSHCFRNSQLFRKALNISKDISIEQEWAIRDLSMGIIPSYLPYIINEIGGKVLYCDQKPVVRGAILDEALIQDYSDGGTALYYSLIAYQTFSKLASKGNFDYKIILEINLNCIKSRLLEIFINPKLQYKHYLKALKMTKLKIKNIISIKLLKSLLKVLFPFLRGIRLKAFKIFNINMENTHEFLEKFKFKNYFDK